MPAITAVPSPENDPGTEHRSAGGAVCAHFPSIRVASVEQNAFTAGGNLRREAENLFEGYSVASRAGVHRLEANTQARPRRMPLLPISYEASVVRPTLLYIWRFWP